MRSTTPSIRRSRRAAGALLAAALLVTGCGSDDTDTAPADTAPAVTEPDDAEPDDAEPGDTEPAATEPTDTAGDDAASATPERVVSLSPTHTEIMFAIGAGDLLVAVEEYSNYPAEALELPNELSGFEPNVEAIAEYEPDLVLIGGDFTGLGDQLAELGIDSWDGPTATTIDDTYAQIEQLGAQTGHVAEAAELVSSMQTRLDEIIADAPTADEPLSVYHEVDSTYYSADSSTFIGEVYDSFGLVNIADAEGDEFGFPQLNAETIIAADPDLIVVPCGNFCTTTAEDVAARPGWDAIAAVQNGNVLEADEDIASRWGPRIVDYYAAVADALTRVAVPA